MSDENGLVTRDSLLQKAKRRFKLIDLADGTRCRIQSLTEGEKSAYEASILTARGRMNRTKFQEATGRLIVLVLVDNAGNRLLSVNDLPEVSKMDGAITAQIYNEARLHCGFEEGDIESLVKNSDEIHADDSPTSSP